VSARERNIRGKAEYHRSKSILLLNFKFLHFYNFKRKDRKKSSERMKTGLLFSCLAGNAVFGQDWFSAIKTGSTSQV